MVKKTIAPIHSSDQRPCLFNETKGSRFALQKSSAPSGMTWDANMTDLSLFGNTITEVVMSCAYAA